MYTNILLFIYIYITALAYRYVYLIIYRIPRLAMCLSILLEGDGVHDTVELTVERRKVEGRIDKIGGVRKA